MANLMEQRRSDAQTTAVFPCICKIMPQHIFNKKDPIIVGMEVRLLYNSNNIYRYIYSVHHAHHTVHKCYCLALYTMSIWLPLHCGRAVTDHSLVVCCMCVSRLQFASAPVINTLLNAVMCAGYS